MASFGLVQALDVGQRREFALRGHARLVHAFREAADGCVDLPVPEVFTESSDARRKALWRGRQEHTAGTQKAHLYSSGHEQYCHGFHT